MGLRTSLWGSFFLCTRIMQFKHFFLGQSIRNFFIILGQKIRLFLLDQLRSLENSEGWNSTAMAVVVT